MLRDTGHANGSFHVDARRGEAFPAPAPASSIRWGDRVVFDRLDLAEALGIWRHATGRVVGTHGAGPGTVDVKFDGHETLREYLPDLFRRAH